MTRLRIISRTTCLCGVAALATVVLAACGSPKPIGLSSVTGSGGSGSGSGYHLTGVTTSTKTNTTTSSGTTPSDVDGGNCGITKNGLTAGADILLVLDKTGSLTRAMDSANECPTGSTTCQQRWATLVSGLNAVLSSASSSVLWGLELFNSDGSCGVDPPEVQMGPGAAVQAYIVNVTPAGSTPTKLPPSPTPASGLGTGASSPQPPMPETARPNTRTEANFFID